MGAIASQITSLTIVYSIVYSDADQRKHQSSVSQAFVRGIHRGAVNSPHKWPVTQQMFPFDDVITNNTPWNMRMVCLLCFVFLSVICIKVINEQWWKSIITAPTPVKYPEALQWRHNVLDDASNNRRLDYLLSRSFRRRSKKTSKLRGTGLCAGNSPVTAEFPASRASNAENVSIWWRHHIPGLLY